MLLGLGEETGGVSGREWRRWAAKACPCDQEEVQAVLRVISHVVASPL